MSYIITADIYKRPLVYCHAFLFITHKKIQLMRWINYVKMFDEGY